MSRRSNARVLAADARVAQLEQTNAMLKSENIGLIETARKREQYIESCERGRSLLDGLKQSTETIQSATGVLADARALLDRIAMFSLAK
jgi:hypothetical protein